MQVAKKGQMEVFIESKFTLKLLIVNVKLKKKIV
jgi:hypothetical protein